MSKPGLSFGLKTSNKAPNRKAAPLKPKGVFGGNSDSEDDATRRTSKATGVNGDYKPKALSSKAEEKSSRKSGNKTPLIPPTLKRKVDSQDAFGDLSSSLTSRKNAQDVEVLDPSTYEYDSVYDSLKPTKKQDVEEEMERKPKYMRSLLQAAEVRKRDALIAEEKKIAREREAEGDKYAGKEQFVTAAYKQQQEENRRLEEEEKRREKAEARKNKDSGMSAFYRKLLDKDEERHAQIVKAAEERAKLGPADEDRHEASEDKEKAEAARARELMEKGISVAVNEDGEVVDRRQLLEGGLNLGAKQKEALLRNKQRAESSEERRHVSAGPSKKPTSRADESRAFEEQLLKMLGN